MIYTIKPGNIAAVCNVIHNDKETSFIYMADGKLPVTLTKHEKDETAAFLTMPMVVRAAVNKHFGTMFALPLERRGEYLKSLQPWQVHECHRDNQDLCHTCGKPMGSA